MRTYKDLDYIFDHIAEIISETPIGELEMEPNYEYTEFSFIVQTEKGEKVRFATCGCYLTWLHEWRSIEVIEDTESSEE